MPSSAGGAAWRCRQVGAGDQVAEVAQDLGDAGHAGAADADEVNVLDRRVSFCELLAGGDHLLGRLVFCTSWPPPRAQQFGAIDVICIRWPASA
jgi:hypothetical protein